MMNGKIQISDDCKAEYAVEVQKTKDVQRDHYETTMPQIFNVNSMSLLFNSYCKCQTALASY